MSPPPKGWFQTPLRDVCELINGRAYKQDELLESGKYRVLRVGNFFSRKIWYYSDLELGADKYCDEGDLLYAWSASFGPRIWDGGKTIFHYHIWKVRCNSKALDKSFLYHWFEWDKRRIQADHGTGSTMIHVTKGDMEARSLNLPPLTEQRRIVAKIDSLSAKSKRVRDRLDHVPRLVARYKEAVLATVFRGDLVRLDSVCEIQSGLALGKQRSEHASVSLVPYLRVANVQRGSLDLDVIKRTTATPAEIERLTLWPGDILMNEGGDRDKLGRGWIWEGQIQNCIHQNHVFRLRLKDGLFPPQYISYFTNEIGRRYFLDEGKQTTNLASVSKSKLAAMPIPIPTAEEAWDVVRRIEAAFAWIDRLAVEATSARKLIDRLDQAVLTNAFQGDLVPQDPADEPASVLLERIRAEKDREAAVKPQRGRPRLVISP